MPQENNTYNRSRKQRLRQRLRGAFTGKKGRAVSIGSLAAPLIGLVVNDLRKPDSIIKLLVSSTANRLLKRDVKKNKAIDITDKVEVLNYKKDKKS